MKTWGWIILIVAIVIIGGYFVLNQPPAATEDEMSGDSMNEEGSMDDGSMNDDTAMDDGSGMDDGSMDDGQEDAVVVRTFNVAGSNFRFSETELRVNKGDTVRINFSVQEGFHDWVIDEFDARTGQMQAGGSQTIEFVADQAGEFEYYCSVGQHRQMGMVGTLIVEE